MGIRAKGAGGVLLIGALGGFAPAAVAASEAVRTGQLTSRQASAPVSYTHLAVMFHQTDPDAREDLLDDVRGAACSCLLYTSRCV